MIYCSRCGKQIPEDSRFCEHCGAERRTAWHDVQSSPTLAPQTTPNPSTGVVAPGMPATPRQGSLTAPAGSLPQGAWAHPASPAPARSRGIHPAIVVVAAVAAVVSALGVGGVMTHWYGIGQPSVTSSAQQAVVRSEVFPFGNESLVQRVATDFGANSDSGLMRELLDVSADDWELIHRLYEAAQGDDGCYAALLRFYDALETNEDRLSLPSGTNPSGTNGSCATVALLTDMFGRHLFRDMEVTVKDVRPASGTTDGSQAVTVVLSGNTWVTRMNRLRQSYPDVLQSSDWGTIIESNCQECLSDLSDAEGVRNALPPGTVEDYRTGRISDAELEERLTDMCVSRLRDAMSQTVHDVNEQTLAEMDMTPERWQTSSDIRDGSELLVDIATEYMEAALSQVWAASGLYVGATGTATEQEMSQALNRMGLLSGALVIDQISDVANYKYASEDMGMLELTLVYSPTGSDWVLADRESGDASVKSKLLPEGMPFVSGGDGFSLDLGDSLFS